MTTIDELGGFCRSVVDLESLDADGAVRIGSAPRSFDVEEPDGYHTIVHWTQDGHSVELTIPPVQLIDVMGPSEELPEGWLYEESDTVLVADTELDDPLCDSFSVAVVGSGDPRRTGINSEARDLLLALVDDLVISEPRPEACGGATAALAVRTEPDVVDAAIGFVKDEFGGAPEVRPLAAVPPTLTAERCLLSVSTSDSFDHAVALSVTGGPGAYHVESADLVDWAADSDGSAPSIHFELGASELLVELDWWCVACATASARIVTPDGDQVPGEQVGSVPLVFRFPPIDAGVAEVRVVDRSGRLVGLRSRAIDQDSLTGGPDCGRLSGPAFASGGSPAEAAERLARMTEVGWNAEVTEEDDGQMPCLVKLTAADRSLEVSVFVAGSNGRYGVVRAFGSVEAPLRPFEVIVEDGAITIDDPFWCGPCSYRFIGVEYEQGAPNGIEASDESADDPRRMVIGPVGGDGRVLVVTYAGERVVELAAVIVPAGEGDHAFDLTEPP